MSEELIDVLTSDGERTGIVKSKSVIHGDGDWHRSTHVWIITPDNRVLLQFRSSEKITHPRMWDVSCAGHVSAGETAEQSAIRELGEELGIDATVDDLVPVGEVVERSVFRDGRYLENEFQSIFVMTRAIDVRDLVLQEGEVDGVSLVSLDEFASRIARRDCTLVPHWPGYAVLLRHLGLR